MSSRHPCPATPSRPLSAPPGTARAWVELMRRLGYERYGLHGGDVGAGVSGLVAGLDGEHVIGVHVVTDPLTTANVAAFIPGMADRLDPNDPADKMILDGNGRVQEGGFRLPGDPEQPAADHRLRTRRLTAPATRLDRRALDRVQARQALPGDGGPRPAGGGPAGVLRATAVTDALSQRGLNRATLARQYLLERARARAIDVIEHLGGMQSQAPLAPYVGLWTRLQDFAPGELSALTEERQVTRLHLMRNTVHLVSARDCLSWRPFFYPLHAAEFRAHFRKGTEGVDFQALLRHAKRLLEERPRTRNELGRLLAECWPDADPSALAYAATHHIALCQVPPRGIWGASAPARWAPVESWLGAPLRPAPVDALVLRYLGAFGPASVADIQVWSGLAGLREVVERLPLRTFRDQSGQTLYDLPDAPRPPEDVPAPPRFLPEYDNLLLSYRDRSRVIPDNRRVPLPPGNGATTGTFLVDGIWQGIWQIREKSLRIQPFTKLSSTDRDALLTEAAQLSAFVDPQGIHEIVLGSP